MRGVERFCYSTLDPLPCPTPIYWEFNRIHYLQHPAWLIAPLLAHIVLQAMGAYRTILTHFSQRYPKFPEGLPDEGSLAASTACAFDGMCVPLAALPLLPALRPAVEYVLAAEEDEATAAAAGGAVVVDGAEVGKGGDGAAGILEAGVQPVQWNP